MPFRHFRERIHIPPGHNTIERCDQRRVGQIPLCVPKPGSCEIEFTLRSLSDGRRLIERCFGNPPALIQLALPGQIKFLIVKIRLGGCQL